MPETLVHVELIRTNSIIQPHACFHAVVEIADDGHHSLGDTHEQGHPIQKNSVIGVICLGKIDQAQLQGSFRLPRQFLQPSYYEHHANRGALGSELTLFLRQNFLAFAIITQATRDHFEEYTAGVTHEGDATIIATLSPVFLLVKHLSRCIFPLLRDATFPPHSDDDIVERSKSVQFSFVVQTTESSAWGPSGPTAVRFANARNASSTSYLDRTSSSGLHGGHCVSVSTMLMSTVDDSSPEGNAIGSRGTSIPYQAP